MPHTLAEPHVLDREFLGIRAKLIELAATLDRIDRTQRPVAADPRMEQIRRGLKALAGETSGRAEEILMIFSLPYEQDWR
jgi:hypothetical protein